MEQRTLPALSGFGEVFLLPHRVGLAHPGAEFGVDVFPPLEAKRVEVVTRRKSLDSAKTRALEPSCEHDVAIEPRAARGDLCERHAHMECDPRLLGEDINRTNLTDRGNDRIEQRANPLRLPGKMTVEVMGATRMRLIAVREYATASLAPPQRPLAHQSWGGFMSG